MRKCDYHLHSEFSFDSAERIDSICEKAVELGIQEIALTDHAEFPSDEKTPWPDFAAREKDLTRCREQYGDRLLIRSGIEAGQPWRDADLERKLINEAMPDFIIASAHELDGFPKAREMVFTRENAAGYYSSYLMQMREMAARCDYDVLGHVTYLFRFLPQELAPEIPPETFRDEYAELFRVIIERGKGIEINCSGLRMPSIAKTLPSPELVRLYRELGGEILTIGSDGHSCRSAFSALDAGVEAARNAGFRYAAAFENRTPSFYRL